MTRQTVYQQSGYLYRMLYKFIRLCPDSEKIELRKHISKGLMSLCHGKDWVSICDSTNDFPFEKNMLVFCDDYGNYDEIMRKCDALGIRYKIHDTITTEYNEEGRHLFIEWNDDDYMRTRKKVLKQWAKIQAKRDEHGTKEFMRIASYMCGDLPFFRIDIYDELAKAV